MNVLSGAAGAGHQNPIACGSPGPGRSRRSVALAVVPGVGGLHQGAGDAGSNGAGGGPGAGSPGVGRSGGWGLRASQSPLRRWGSPPQRWPGASTRARAIAPGCCIACGTLRRCRWRSHWRELLSLPVGGCCWSTPHDGAALGWPIARRLAQPGAPPPVGLSPRGPGTADGDHLPCGPIATGGGQKVLVIGAASACRAGPGRWRSGWPRAAAGGRADAGGDDAVLRVAGSSGPPGRG